MRKALLGIAIASVLVGCSSPNVYKSESLPMPTESEQEKMTLALPSKVSTMYVRSRARTNPKLDCYKVDTEYQTVITYVNKVKTNAVMNAKVLSIQPIPCAMAKGPIQ